MNCSYCKAPAVVELKYRGYLARAGKPPLMPLHTIRACAEHEHCPNFESHLSIHPDVKVHALGVAR